MLDRPALHLVPDDTAEPAKPETVAQRVRRLQAEAKAAAREHVLTLVVAMSVAREHAAAIAGGGDVYPAGVREAARRFAEDCQAAAETIQAIASRVAR